MKLGILAMALAATWFAGTSHARVRHTEGMEVPHVAPPPPPPVSTRPAPLPAGHGGTGGTVYARLEALFNDGDAWNPPDPHAAAGPQGILQVTNSEMGYYRRDGLPVWEVSFEEFTGATKVWVDPKVVFDPVSERFIISALRHKCAESHLLLLVSKDADPDRLLNGTADPDDWHRYEHSMLQQIGSDDHGGDYTGLAFDGSNIYVTFNMLRLPFRTWPDCGPVDAGFHHGTIFVVDKSDAIKGTFTHARVDAPAGQGFTLQPAQVVGSDPAGSVAYFAESAFSSAAIRVWALSDPFGTPSLTSATVPVPNNGGIPTCAPQAGGGDLDSFNLWAQSAWWREGALWFCLTAAGPSMRAVPYYYEIATNGFPASPPTLSESGGIDGGSGVWNFQPALGMNPAGDLCMVFTQSSAATYPRLMAVTRRATDAGFSDPFLVQSSPAYYDPTTPPGGALCGWAHRWGDYAGVTYDPYDESFWVTHELAAVRTDQPYPWTTALAKVLFTPSGGWASDGVALTTGWDAAHQPRILADGSGGAYFAWNDHRTLTHSMRVHRLTAAGTRAEGWSYTGNLLSRSELPQEVYSAAAASLAADDSSGVYVVREGSINKISVQRLLPHGAIAGGWVDEGLAVTFAAPPGRTAGVPDGSGNLIVATRVSGKVRVLKVNRDRTLPWGSTGIEVGTAASNGSLAIVADGLGGAIVAWEGDSLRVQRYHSGGAAQWGATGKVLSVTGSDVVAAADGSGGIVVVTRRRDTPTSSARDVYAVRASASGDVVPGWTGGVAVVAAPGNQAEAQMIPAGDGGAIVAWTDHGVSGGKVRALRLGSSGSVASGWSGGVAVTSAAGDGAQTLPALASDGASGALVTWQDGRGIFVEHLLANGARQPGYPVDGLAIADESAVASSPRIATTGAHVGMVVWEAARATTAIGSNAIHAQAAAFDPVAPGAIELSASGGCRDRITLSWRAPGDDGSTGTATEYDLRWSAHPIDPGNFAGATPIPTPAPSPAGQREELVVSVPECSAPRYYAIQTRDEWDNVSALSNAPSAGPSCPPPPEPCDDVVARSPDPAPGRLALAPPAPTPARNRVRIAFAIPREGAAWELSAFDVSGRRLATIARDAAKSGAREVHWDLRADDGQPLREGVYYVRLQCGGEALHRRLVVVR